MQDYGYSIIGSLAIVIHLIINFNTICRREGPFRAYRAYRSLIISLLIYCLTDVGWGIFSGLEWTAMLFADTTVYFIAMGAAVVCCNYYIVEYLDLQGRFASIFKYAGMVLFVLETGALIVNFFVPCFFWFDETGAYVTGTLRYVMLWVQIVMFFLACCITITVALKSAGITRKRNYAIFLFSFVMFIAIIFQSLLPLYPVYALGCLIGSCILHVYVVEDEREEYRQIIAKEKNTAEEANKAKTAFLFSMSHDIRTPMNAILGYEAMARKKSTDETVNDYLQKIDVAGNQLLSLVNQVLEMSRIESGRIVLQEQRIDMDESEEMVRTIYAEQARAKGIHMTVELRNLTHKHAIGDSDRVSQIMNNLLGNAIKYTREGGSIFNYVEEEPCDKPGYAIYRMTVEDTGIGISEEFLPHIFEEFSREETSTVSHIQGTGLGMSIVKKLVDLMDGTIEVTSKLGEGSKFIVRIPLKIDTEHSEAPVAEAEGQDISLEGMKILLVEDNEMNREIAEEILSDAGAQIDTAEDGVIAVEKVANSVPGQYDVVLMDVQMPRMDGYEATRRIRALEDPALAGITIFAMTTNAFAEDRQNALEAGMNGHLTKPIDIPKLLSTLSQLK